MEFGFYYPKFKEVTWSWTHLFIIIIVIIMWLVRCWTLPFIWACSRLDDSALDDRRLSNQCWVVLDRILEPWSGARCDAVSPIGSSSPLAKGPHRSWARLWSIDGSARAMWPKNLRRVVRMMCTSGGWSVLREIYRACTYSTHQCQSASPSSETWLRPRQFKTGSPDTDHAHYWVVEVCGNDFLVPIPFPLPFNHSHSHSHPFPFQHCIPIPIFPITSIPIPTHSRSHFWQRLYIDYLKAEKYV